jgi:crotonobetaine/carnitine-CoA ligase
MVDFALEDRVLPKVLAAAAQALPDNPYILFREDTYSYADTELVSTQFAHGLRQWGVIGGSRVAAILDNSPQYIFTLFAIAKLGALNVPINTAARGQLLAYFLADCESTHVIVQEDYVDVLLEAWGGTFKIPTLVLRSGEKNKVAAAGAGLPTWHDVLSDGFARRETSLDTDLKAWDPWLILYTSGTTGPSKGSVCPHAQSLTIGRTQVRRMDIGPNDRMYTFLPLFHGNALNYSTVTALWGRACIALETRFSASRFWADIHRYQATQFNAMMIVTSVLEKLPVTAEEKNNPVRIAVMVPPPANRRELELRWGLSIISQYAMSEAHPITVLDAGQAYDKPRTSGRVDSSMEVRIVDENDVEVPRGTPGEVTIRTREPWTMLLQYYGKAEATMQAFRNLWFHTGDRAFLDEDGYLFFVDRVKDAIRRRGENISAYEIEFILRGHSDIVEVAAIPVPSEMGEDEVATYIVRRSPDLTEKDVVEFAIDRMAYFMVPRFVQFIDELPKTPSQKVQKFALREMAKASYNNMWDREKAGIVVTRFTAQERKHEKLLDAS